jgi:hypothetical protein
MLYGGRTFSPAAEFFGWFSRKFLKLVGNTAKDKKYGHMAQTNVDKDKTLWQLGQNNTAKDKKYCMDTWPKQM